jgi:electron transfer flavoprotein alpha subunit
MASDILVFGEIRSGTLKKVAKELIGTARIIAAGTGGSIDAALVGEGAGGAADFLKEFGLRKTRF